MDLSFEGIINARDLGGLPAGGGFVRPGCLLRTAFLAEATDNDIKRLQELPLKAIFDFRSLPEAEAAPDRQVPGAEIIHLPTLDQEAERASGEAVPEQTWLDLPRHIVDLSFTHLFQKKARELYPSLILSEFSQLQYAAFLNMIILKGEDGAVLWHCSQGKDRTGIGAALILGILGASRETIVEDFDLSNRVYKPLVDSLCAQVAAKGGGEGEMDVIRAFMGVSTRNFCATLDLIDRQWGSLQDYIVSLLGITEDDIALLRKRYLVFE